MSVSEGSDLSCWSFWFLQCWKPTFNWTVSGNSKTRNVDQKWVSNIATDPKNSNNSDPNPHSHSSLMCTICGKTNHTTQDCRTVGRNGCIALHYYVHFLRIFSFVTRGIESEGIGARSVLSRLRLCNAQPARENVGIELRVTIYVCHWSTHSTT